VLIVFSIGKYSDKVKTKVRKANYMRKWFMSDVCLEFPLYFPGREYRIIGFLPTGEC
jgi:hypothetical protein